MKQKIITELKTLKDCCSFSDIFIYLSFFHSTLKNILHNFIFQSNEKRDNEGKEQNQTSFKVFTSDEKSYFYNSSFVIYSFYKNIM